MLTDIDGFNAPTEHPEPIESDAPECPRCNMVHEFPQNVEEYHVFNCKCGARFWSYSRTVIVSWSIGDEKQ